jgi:hypothetical protein
MRGRGLGHWLIDGLGAVCATTAVFLFVKDQIVLSLVAGAVFILLITVGHRVIDHNRNERAGDLGEQNRLHEDPRFPGTG